MKIVESSFGYDMTINDYFVVLSENDKTAMLQPIGKIVKDDYGLGSGRSIPDASKVTGEPFRARVVKSGNGISYSSPKYITGHWADEWNGKPNYYNTWD